MRCYLAKCTCVGAGGGTLALCAEHQPRDHPRVQNTETSKGPYLQMKAGMQEESKDAFPPGAYQESYSSASCAHRGHCPHLTLFTAPPFARRLPPLPQEPDLTRTLGGCSFKGFSSFLGSRESQSFIYPCSLIGLLSSLPPFQVMAEGTIDVPYHSSPKLSFMPDPPGPLQGP